MTMTAALMVGAVNARILGRVRTMQSEEVGEDISTSYPPLGAQTGQHSERLVS